MPVVTLCTLCFKIHEAKTQMYQTLLKSFYNSTNQLRSWLAILREALNPLPAMPIVSNEEECLKQP